MKLIKLTDDRYVVVNEIIQPVNGYYYDSFINKIKSTNGAEYGEASHCWQITHSTQPMPHGVVREGQITGVTAISLQEVKELIGEADVEKKAREEHEQALKRGGSEYAAGYYEGLLDGYNQALEDNKEKKYTQEQLIWAIQEAYGHGQDDEFDGVNKIEESIKAITKHLQPKTEWEVEWETIDNRQPCDCSCHNNPNMIHFVACCNDGWIGKITQKLKLK